MKGEETRMWSSRSGGFSLVSGSAGKFKGADVLSLDCIEDRAWKGMEEVVLFVNLVGILFV